MNEKIHIFEKEKVGAIQKIPESILTDPRFELRKLEIEDGLMAQMRAFIYAQIHETQEVTCTAPRPSFLDWLLRRQRQVTLNVTVKDLLIEPPATGTQRIYTIEEQP